MLFGSKRNWEFSNPTLKVPVDKKHFPWAPDEDHNGKIFIQTKEKPKRLEKTEPKATTNMIKLEAEDLLVPFINYPKMSEFHQNEPMFQLFKVAMFGHMSIYRPSHRNKELTFDAQKPEDVRDDKLVVDNEYQSNPLEAEIVPEMPPWSDELKDDVNITEERIELLSMNIY